ncbi:MAG: type II toxin-antitoxin system HipA family toxin [Gammaproteobacteria bacterium]
MADRSLEIAVHGRPVAHLIEHDGGYGGYDLAYLPDADAESFVALALHDVRGGDYSGYQQVPAALLQNLPEGALLALIRETFGKALNLATDFDLLRAIGPNLRGRVTVLGSASEQGELSIGEILEQRGSAEFFRSCVERLGLAGAGVSGVQPKFTTKVDNRATAVVDDVIVKFRPFDGTLTGPIDRDYPGLAINEYYALRAAKFAGIESATTQLSADGEMLVVDRFDLPWDSPALGFDDACSLSELAPEHRYQGSYQEMHDLLLRWLPSAERADAEATLFRLLILNVIIGNGDAHRKNHGLVYASRADIRLAPAYDILSTMPYLPDDTMALALSDETPSKAWPDAQTLRDFGRATMGFTPARVRDHAERVRDAVDRAARELSDYVASGPESAQSLKSLPALWRRRIDAYRAL